MPCSLSAIQAAACLSGIGKEQNRIKLLQWIAQLTCEAAEAGAGSGGASPLTVETFVGPSFPFNYTAPSRAIVEVAALLISDTGIGGYEVARTGVPNMTVSIQLGQPGSVTLDLNNVSSFRLGPGDSITLTNVSTGNGSAIMNNIVVYSE